MMNEKTSITNLIRWYDSKIVCTGGVVFIGAGNTGKTHTAINLTGYRGRGYYNESNATLKKSINLELDYFVFYSNIEEYKITTSSQIFIMPGQKGRALDGEGLAFEDACDLYFKVATLNEIMVLILTYDLTNINTFQELEYWLDRAIERDFIQDYTSIILLGTHNDVKENIIITEDYIDTAERFISYNVLKKKGLDIGNRIYSLKISNLTGEGISELKKIINLSFLSAFNIQEFIFGHDNRF